MHVMKYNSATNNDVSDQQISVGHAFATRGHSATFGLFFIVMTREGCSTVMYWLEVRDAANHPTVQRGAPCPTQAYPVPRLRSPVLCLHIVILLIMMMMI